MIFEGFHKVWDEFEELTNLIISNFTTLLIILIIGIIISIIIFLTIIIKFLKLKQETLELRKENIEILNIINAKLDERNKNE